MSALHLTSENFESEVLKSDKPVVVDFWAAWCGPCKMLAPIIEQVADEVTDVKVCKVDVDEEPKLAEKYNVMNIPTIVLFKEGEAVKRTVGAMPKSEVVKFISE